MSALYNPSAKAGREDLISRPRLKMTEGFKAQCLNAKFTTSLLNTVVSAELGGASAASRLPPTGLFDEHIGVGLYNSIYYTYIIDVVFS